MNELGELPKLGSFCRNKCNFRSPLTLALLFYSDYWERWEKCTAKLKEWCTLDVFNGAVTGALKSYIHNSLTNNETRSKICPNRNIKSKQSFFPVSKTSLLKILGCIYRWRMIFEFLTTELEILDEFMILHVIPIEKPELLTWELTKHVIGKAR